MWVIKKPTACKPYNDNAVFSILMMTTVMLLNYLPLRLNLHINIRNVQGFHLTKSFFFPLTDQGSSCKYIYFTVNYILLEKFKTVICKRSAIFKADDYISLYKIL